MATFDRNKPKTSTFSGSVSTAHVLTAKCSQYCFLSFTVAEIGTMTAATSLD